MIDMMTAMLGDLRPWPASDATVDIQACKSRLVNQLAVLERFKKKCTRNRMLLRAVARLAAYYEAILVGRLTDLKLKHRARMSALKLSVLGRDVLLFESLYVDATTPGETDIDPDVMCLARLFRSSYQEPSTGRDVAETVPRSA